MISDHAQNVLPVDGDGVGVLARDVGVRLLNCSASGCLLESRSRLEVGTVGSLRLTLGDRELADQIVVVRCKQIEGAGGRFHVGARFLGLVPPTGATVRRVLGHSSEA
jgi:hypothetical protein